MSTQFPTNGLQDLIMERKRDRTYQELEADCGGTPTKSNIHRLATKPITDMPTTEVMRGLAKGLRVRIVDIVRAAATSVGLPMGEVSPNDLVIADAGRLPSDSQQALMATAANMLWWKEQVEAQASAEVPDNVHHLHAAKEPADEWSEHAARSDQPGLEKDQLPDD